MKLSLLKAALLVTVIFTTTAFAQEQGLTFNFFGGGARSEGMGQAYLAISNDGSAGGWNPAGLNVQEKTLMAFSYGFLMPRGKYTFFETPALSRSYPHSGDYGALNDWSIISPIRIKNHHFVLNMSYTRNFDVYYKFGERLVTLQTLGIQDTFPNAFFNRQGGINSINFAFGTRIYSRLSMGISANIYTGKVATEEIRNLQYVSSFQGEDFLTKSVINVFDSTAYSGFNTAIGFIYEAPRFRGGLLIRTPFNLTGSSDSSTYRITSFNLVGKPDVVRSDLTDTVFVNDMSSKIEIPLILGVGAAYNANENWLLSADIEYKNFANKMIKNLDSILLTTGGERLEFYHNTDPHWSNVLQLRLGTEYLLHSKFGTIPLRAGFRNEEFPFGNISNYSVIYQGEKGTTVNDSSRVSYLFQYNNNKITGLSFSLGTGIQWSQIMLDVAYTFTTYKQDINQDAVLRAENKWDNHHLNLTFTGYF